MYVGGAGGYSFYVRGGEQVIRQRKNNSNYGEGASRTMAQMIRRIRWGNLVNVFKSQKSWQPKAYDSKTKGQTDYNIFMSLNINQATVGFTKEMCEAGCAVIEGYQVSRGSLPPISLSPSQSGNNYVTDIKISNAIQGGTTVGQLAADILANNSQFSEGDNIAFIFFRNWKTSRTEWPYASSVYAEITLDTTSTTVINSIPALDNRLSKSTGGFLQASWSSAGEFDPTREVGFVAIHTRKSASMLAVSSQEIIMNSNSLVSQFSGAAWDNQCVLSYGLTDEVPLDPSFPEGVITSVTANGSEVSNNDTLTGSQVLRVYGNNLTPGSYSLTMNGTRFTPLRKTDEFDEFIIDQNGMIVIAQLGRQVLMSFEVQGVIIPEGLPTKLSMSQREGSINPVNRVNTIGVCINYPYMYDESHPNFFIDAGSSEQPYHFHDLDDENYEGVNCDVRILQTSPENVTWISITVTDVDEIAYVKYKGIIFAVLNYTL